MWQPVESISSVRSLVIDGLCLEQRSRTRKRVKNLKTKSGGPSAKFCDWLCCVHSSVVNYIQSLLHFQCHILCGLQLRSLVKARLQEHVNYCLLIMSAELVKLSCARGDVWEQMLHSRRISDAYCHGLDPLLSSTVTMLTRDANKCEQISRREEACNDSKLNVPCWVQCSV